ncbi:TetR/AcrR family transcriptional regulator [Mycobacterium spongiae]|uniref:TetR family transcriptional regulator n=1 Tax=Mycobacterium spongiae TaxID=886343 RepID=A0A975PYI7_9MYCO|nr:TetR/AcrR family transcriptional regulator [Mycobacterium spongiae]QUR69356.1 TetR family transcriptional regulator [Mycobacterium spongiae]
MRTADSVPERLLNAGLSLFHERGYNGTGVQQITLAAGVPKGSFYNYYSGKESLAIAALHRYNSGIPIPTLFDTSVGGPAARIRAHFEALRETFAASGYRNGCLMGKFAMELADASERTRTTLEEMFHTWQSSIASVLAEAQYAGEIANRCEPAILAEYLLQGWQGAVLATLVTKRQETLDAYFNTTFDVVLAARDVAPAANT